MFAVVSLTSLKEAKGVKPTTPTEAEITGVSLIEPEQGYLSDDQYAKEEVESDNGYELPSIRYSSLLNFSCGHSVKQS